jgi:Ca2+-binding EF-hand superfamily protein
MIYEMLDENHTGMISAKNLRNFLELAERLKISKFNQ